jgi:hypothetical protein
VITVTVHDAVSITTAGLTKMHETEPTKISKTTMTDSKLSTTKDSTTTEEVLPTTAQVPSSTEKLIMSTSVDISTAGEFVETTTTGNAVYTTDGPTTTEEVLSATTQIASSTEELLLSTSVYRSTAAVISRATKTGDTVYTTDGSTTVYEVFSASPQVSSSTDVLLFSTSADSSTAAEISGTTKTGDTVYTTDGSTTADKVLSASPQVASSTDELLFSTSADRSTAAAIYETATRGKTIYTTDVSTTSEEVLPATTQVSSLADELLFPTSVDSSTDGEIATHPTANEAVIDYLNYTSLPPGCFANIDQRCLFSDDPEKFSCSDNEISKLIAVELLVDFSLEIGGFLNEKVSPEITQSNATVIHNAICQNSTEISWIEVIKVFSDNGTAIIIEISPMYTAVSFLQLRTTSFGTSSVQLACHFVNGDAQEFSSIVGGIVSGYTISETQYDCTSFVTIYVIGNSTVPANLTTSSSAMNEYYDLPDNVGLPIEYTIVCIYIVLSYMAAFKAYKLHMLQRTRTDFKTNINLSFVVLFLIWASGNLLYLVLYSAALTDTNFFYIKSVLTLTYFATYSGFILIVHYRYILDFSLL